MNNSINQQIPVNEQSQNISNKSSIGTVLEEKSKIVYFALSAIGIVAIIGVIIGGIYFISKTSKEKDTSTIIVENKNCTYNGKIYKNSESFNSIDGVILVIVKMALFLVLKKAALIKQQ